MDNFVRVRHKRNAEDERTITRKAYEVVKRDYIIIDAEKTEAPVIPNVPAPEKSGDVADATGEVKVRNKPGTKPKPVINEA